MKISRLYLKDFKNLKNFEVDFDESSNRQVVIGRNGVGKSTLFEAIIRIFRDIDLNSYELTNFSYDIEYSCRGFGVKISNKLINEKECKIDPTTVPKYKRKNYVVVENNELFSSKGKNYKKALTLNSN